MDQPRQPATTHGRAPSGSASDLRLIEGLLSNLALFRQVAQAHIATVAAHTRIQHVRRGSVLCRRGEPLPGVMVLAYGSAKLALRRQDGEEKVVRFLGAGDSFGEAAALHALPSPLEAVALTDSLVVLVPPLPLLRLFELDPGFARNLVRLLSDRFLGLLAEHESSLQQSALQRLAAYLESLAEPNGAPGCWIARLPASKTAVASRLGITKETMSRLLRQLANRGVIAVARRDIEVRDRSALAQVAR